jgi:hypothetical protein
MSRDWLWGAAITGLLVGSWVTAPRDGAPNANEATEPATQRLKAGRPARASDGVRVAPKTSVEVLPAWTLG